MKSKLAEKYIAEQSFNGQVYASNAYVAAELAEDDMYNKAVESFCEAVCDVRKLCRVDEDRKILDKSACRMYRDFIDKMNENKNSVSKNFVADRLIKSFDELIQLADEGKCIAYKAGWFGRWYIRPAAFMIQWQLAKLRNISMYTVRLKDGAKSSRNR